MEEITFELQNFFTKTKFLNGREIKVGSSEFITDHQNTVDPPLKTNVNETILNLLPRYIIYHNIFHKNMNRILCQKSCFL